MILSLAGVSGAVALAISQLAAADPDPSSTPSSKETTSAQSPHSPGDPQKFCGWSAFDGPRDKLKGHHWGRHRAHRSKLQMLDRMLNLTEEQKKKVNEIVDASKPKIKAIREEQWMKIQAVMDDARKQIRPILSPDQQKVFDDVQELRESARKLRQDAWKLHQEKESEQSE